MGATVTARLSTLEERRTRAALARFRSAWVAYCEARPTDPTLDDATRRARFERLLAEHEARLAALPPAERARSRAAEQALETLIDAAPADLPAVRRAAAALATDPATATYTVLDALATYFNDLARAVAAGETEEL
jgi:hypothetical protein